MSKALTAICITAFFLLVSFNQARGADLALLIKEARENNPGIAALRHKIASKEARSKAEGALEDPTLKVEMEDLSRTHPFDISPDKAMLTRYTLAQAFPFPGKLGLKEKIAYQEALFARSELKAMERELEAQVKEAYFDYAFLTESSARTEGLKALIGDVVKAAEARYSTGKGGQQDVIKAQAESTMLTNELITIAAEREIAAERIRSLINKQGEDLTIEGQGLSGAQVDIRTGELIEAALQNNPDINMMEAELQAAELNKDLARKNYYPDFMVGVAPIQRGDRFDSYDLMFQVNIPIWRGKYDNRTSEAASDALAMRSRLLSAKNIKALEIKSAALQAQAAGRMLSLYETGLLPQAELSFESSLKAYQSGRAEFMTLLDSERELRKTRIESLKTLLDYRKKIAALEKASGRELSGAPETR